MRDRLSLPWTLLLLALAGSGIYGSHRAIRALDLALMGSDLDLGIPQILQIFLLIVVAVAGSIVGLIGSVGGLVGAVGNLARARRAWLRWRNRREDLVREVMES